MASGPAVTVAGGTDMQQVVAGTDLVEDNDFSNMWDNVNALLAGAHDVALGTFTLNSTFGYTQGGAGVGDSAPGGLVYADNTPGGFKRLQDDVQALADFLDITLRPGVGTDVTDSDIIGATLWSNTMLDIKNIFDNRFNVPASSLTTARVANRNFGSAWSTALIQETTFTFAGEAHCRGFFNAGGKIGFRSNRLFGTASLQNTDWTNLLVAAGDVYMTYNDTTSDSGTSANLGFYGLTPAYAQLHTKLSSGAGASAYYASNDWTVRARVNSVTNPTIVTLQSQWNDDSTSGVDSVDGSIFLDVYIQQPTGGITVAKPLIQAGLIVGS